LFHGKFEEMIEPVYYVTKKKKQLGEQRYNAKLLPFSSELCFPPQNIL